MKRNTRKGYTVNHFNRTITLTRNFSNKASIPGTEEYRIPCRHHAIYAVDSAWYSLYIISK